MLNKLSLEMESRGKLFPSPLLSQNRIGWVARVRWRSCEDGEWVLMKCVFGDRFYRGMGPPIMGVAPMFAVSFWVRYRSSSPLPLLPSVLNLNNDDHSNLTNNDKTNRWETNRDTQWERRSSTP